MAVSASTQKLFRTVVVRCKPPIKKKKNKKKKNKKKRYLLLRVRVIKSRDNTNMRRNNSILIGL